jgi:hypothetical protein
MSNEKLVHALERSGYARVSNSRNVIARIDRRRWLKAIARHLGSEEAAVNMNRRQAADMYRRMFSPDRRTVTRDIAQALPSSLDGPCDWVPIKQRAAEILAGWLGEE